MKTNMSKRLLLMLVSMILVVSMFTGCGGSDKNAVTTTPDVKTTEDSNGGEKPLQKEDKDYKVAILTIRKLTTPADLNTLEGIEKLEKDLGVKCKIIECVEIAEYKEQLQAVSEEGYDVVYFIYDNFLEAAKEIAPLYPETQYIGLWIDLKDNQIPNLKPLFFRPEQGAFMCGVVAGLMTETNKVAFLGGGINPGIVTFLAGYEAGIKNVNPNCELIVSWANTFEDPLKGKELATSLYSRDVDIIFQVANQTGLGVIDAAKEMGKYVIGVDVDQSPLAPENVISSCLLDHGYATFDSISKSFKGEFTNKQVYYGLQEGSPVIAVNDKLVSKEIQDKVKEIEKKIISGEIETPKTTETK